MLRRYKVGLIILGVVLVFVVFKVALIYRSITYSNVTDFQGEERLFAQYALGVKGYDAVSPLSTDIFKVITIERDNRRCVPDMKLKTSYKALVIKYTWDGKEKAKFVAYCDGGVDRL